MFNNSLGEPITLATKPLFDTFLIDYLLKSAFK